MFNWLKQTFNRLFKNNSSTPKKEMSVNTMGDQEEEKNDIPPCGCIKDSKDDRDYIKPIIPDNTVKEHLLAAASSSSFPALSSQFSLKHLAPPVRNQESTSACTGYAGTSAVYILLNKAYNQSGLSKANLNEQVKHYVKVPKLSPEFTYWYARMFDNSLPRDCGATLRSLMKSLKEYGVLPSKNLDTTLSYGITSAPEYDPKCNTVKINSYFRIPINDETKDQIKNILLVEQIPIIAGIYLYKEQLNTAKKTGRIYPVDDLFTANCIGGHAICITGYKEELDPITNKVITWFEFQNSWGSSNWGDNGYGYLHEDLLGHINYMLDIWCFDKNFW